jgi:dTDP-4-amino-4,6-dideoxygalactose transaminase
MPNLFQATEKLEVAFARWLPAAGVVGTGFGRGSLLLALNIIGLPKVPDWKEVLLPNFICRQVVEAIERSGARPVFYPIGRNLAPGLAELSSRISGREAAVIIPHLYGCALTGTKEILRLARERHVPVIEDCAQSLGARLDGRRAGTFGDFAAFSLTKSDWNFGGGLLAVAHAQDLARAMELAQAFRDDRAAARYGILRLADYMANRPRWCRLATLCGSLLERLTRSQGAAGAQGKVSQNFYDFGSFDSRMASAASRRGLRLLAPLSAGLARLDDEIGRRREKASQIIAALARRPGPLRIVQPEAFAEGNWAYLLCDISQTGRGIEDWIDAADRRGITLRPTWPYFQQPLENQKTEDLAWLAENLLVLEIHPRLASSEVQRISEFLSGAVL